jgi:hypothetical protein
MNVSSDFWLVYGFTEYLPTLGHYWLLFYFWVTVKVGQGRQWARWTYACLVALECAILAAYGLDQASDLESLMTYLTLPVEILAMYWLFGAQADDWFRRHHSEPT